MIRTVKGLATQHFIDLGISVFPGMNQALARQRLNELNAASSIAALSALHGTRLRRLRGKMRGYWAMDVNAGCRILFRFLDGNAYDVHILEPI